jgi:hypothetical protein
MTADVELRLPVLGDSLDDDLPVGQVIRERQQARDTVTCSRQAEANSGADSATVTSRPRKAATWALPEQLNRSS